MISFWVNAAGTFGIEQYLARRAPELMDRFEVRTYEGLRDTIEVTAGAHIFSALDQLSVGGRTVVSDLYDRLREQRPAHRLLNDPRRVWLRYELLTRMFEAGINRFRAYRATDSLDAMRFPVFLREESGHNGALTRLLGSRREVARALRALRARGFRIDDLLVVEFCDLSDADGRFRMATAFKVGEHIVPGFLLSGRHWMLKWDESDHDEPAMQEYLDHILQNPHEAWLRRVFELAGVDYGRIDYGVRGETLQVWEINLNPTPGPGRGPEPPPFAPKVEALLQEWRRVYYGALEKAFRALDAGVGESRISLRLDPALIARMRSEMARRARRRAGLRFLHRIYDHPLVGWPFRAVYSRLLPPR